MDLAKRMERMRHEFERVRAQQIQDRKELDDQKGTIKQLEAEIRTMHAVDQHLRRKFKEEEGEMRKEIERLNEHTMRSTQELLDEVQSMEISEDEMGEYYESVIQKLYEELDQLRDRQPRNEDLNQINEERQRLQEVERDLLKREKEHSRRHAQDKEDLVKERHRLEKERNTIRQESDLIGKQRREMENARVELGRLRTDLQNDRILLQSDRMLLEYETSKLEYQRTRLEIDRKEVDSDRKELDDIRKRYEAHRIRSEKRLKDMLADLNLGWHVPDSFGPGLDDRQPNLTDFETADAAASRSPPFDFFFME
ncbi:MAG: hypothetical protein Q9208_006802 [Pyrenodesmia sp. 3 TL-2023]